MGFLNVSGFSSALLSCNFFEKQVLLGAVVCTGAQYTAQWAIMGPKIVLK